MERLLRWLEIPIQLFLWIALIAGFLMMIHVTVDVSGRAFLGGPLDGTTEIVSAYYMIIVAYLPWAFLARNDSHIAADIFTRSFSPRFAFWLEIAVKILTLAYVSIFVHQTASQAVGQTNIREVWQAGSIFIPVWPSRWVPPVAGFLMVLYLILRVARDIARGAPHADSVERA